MLLHAIRFIHIACGLVALIAGALALAARKGGRVHVASGTWFCVSMFALGVSASILEPFRNPPGSPVAGAFVCYFVATAWLTARRRGAAPAGAIDRVACATVLMIGAAIIADGLRHALAPRGTFPEPPNAAVLFALGTLCVIAGLADLRYIIRGNLSHVQRISRHLWRMCFALFIATGSFFLGQQQVLPQALRGSTLLWILAFAPFAVMAFWLVRVRWTARRAEQST